MRQFTLKTFTFLSLISSVAFGASGTTKNALWIEVREYGDRQTVIAITKDIAAFLVEAEDRDVCFSRRHNKELVTKDMLRAVLSGRQESIEVHDAAESTDISISMKPLEVPSSIGRNQKLILETRKGNKKTFKISIPDIEIEAADDEENSVELSLGWRALLPFITEKGGAVYVKDVEEDTEVWAYVD